MCIFCQVEDALFIIRMSRYIYFCILYICIYMLFVYVYILPNLKKHYSSYEPIYIFVYYIFVCRHIQIYNIQKYKCYLCIFARLKKHYSSYHGMSRHIYFCILYICICYLCIFARLKKHYSSYEPTLRQLKQKYESAMKEKMLTKLERDRAVGQVQGLKNTLRNMEQQRSSSGFESFSAQPGSCCLR